MLTLAGCGVVDLNETTTVKTDYTFTGENASWSAIYRVTGERTFNNEDMSQYSGHYDYVLIVTHKSDLSDLSNIKNLDINR